MATELPERRATACHEAGHAVMAFDSDGETYRIEILRRPERVANGVRYGAMARRVAPVPTKREGESDTDLNRRRADYLEAELRILLAGPVAERFAAGDFEDDDAVSLAAEVSSVAKAGEFDWGPDDCPTDVERAASLLGPLHQIRLSLGEGRVKKEIGSFALILVLMARKKIEAQRRHIDRLAEELLARGALSAEEVRTVLSS